MTIIIVKYCKKSKLCECATFWEKVYTSYANLKLHILNTAKACEVDAFKIDTKSNY